MWQIERTAVVLHRCYARDMETISQRELRNHSAEIMRGLAQGKSYRLTRRGVPVGQVTPLDGDPLEELTLRRGRGPMSFPSGVRRRENLSDVLEDLRSEG